MPYDTLHREAIEQTWTPTTDFTLSALACTASLLFLPRGNNAVHGQLI